MFDISKYDKWLVATKDGLRLSKDAPKSIKEEIAKINKEYKEIGREGKLLEIEV